MKDPQEIELTNCDVCSTALKPHPLYPDSVAKTCPKHGDYFIQRFRDRDAVITFVPFEKEHGAPNTPRKRLSRISPENHQVRKNCFIRCDQTGVVFKNQTQAALTMGLSQSCISKYLLGTRDSVKGYTFTIHENGEKPQKRLKPYKPPPTRAPKKIRCEETKEVFDSIRQAAQTLHVSRGNIYLHMQARRKQVNGYTFTYVD